MSIVESITASTNRNPIKMASDNKPSRILKYLPAAATESDCAQDRSALLSAFDICRTCGIYGRGGKNPILFGSDECLASLPIMFRDPVAQAMRTIIGTFTAISVGNAPSSIVRETFAVNGCNLSARVACSVFMGEPTALSAGQIRNALGVAAKSAR